MYDISKFIEKIQDKDYFEIISFAHSEIKSAEKASYKVKGAVRARENGSEEYIDELRKFLFCISSGIKPNYMDSMLFEKIQQLKDNIK